MDEEQRLRLKALELAVELRRTSPTITGDITVKTAQIFEAYLKDGR